MTDPPTTLPIATSSAMVNTASSLTQFPQSFVLPGHYSWAGFQTLDSIIRQDSKLHITYLDGVIKLIPLGEEHESISRVLGILIALYLVKRNIEFTTVGSSTRSSEEKSVSFESDESYFLGEKKEHPDLAVAVKINNNSLDKLDKYKRLGIQEFWMWSKINITVYCLEDKSYSLKVGSQLLPKIDMKLLESCILMPSRLEAINHFLEGL